MAVIPVSSKYPCAQEHIPMCIKHDLNIDMTCEDCDEFICSQCAKTDHKDHDWKTIPTAGSLRRRELKKTLSKVKENDIAEIDKKMKKASKQKEGNKKCCDSEVSKLQKHYDAIVSKLDEIKKNLETKLVENLERKNAEVSKKKLDLEKKRDHIKDLVEFLEDKHGTMSDYSLIDNLRDLTNLVSNTDSDIERGDHSVRYRGGDISEGSLDSIMGQTFDLDDFRVTETDSFQYGDECLYVFEAIKKDVCLVRALESECMELINIGNKEVEKSNVRGDDVCVTANGDVYATDYDNNCVVRLSPSGSVSTVFSTAPLLPVGICQSTGGLLATLVDDKTKKYHPDSKSRRLVIHVTLTGDVIREYEYQEDDQTMLFTVPWRVKQNGNTDICVVNRTSQSTGELVILSSSGFLKSVYHGQNLNFNPTDVVFASHCNIIVTDFDESKIHLLSPDGEFMKYLLTENEVPNPYSMSLYQSTLWVGDYQGLIKVFQFNNA
uniref:B box-type domain-containing protein n=3 Tax=Magallana gigas TaxID=29159 RepID=A0A8W8M5C0_MAGGI